MVLKTQYGDILQWIRNKDKHSLRHRWNSGGGTKPLLKSGCESAVKSSSWSPACVQDAMIGLLKDIVYLPISLKENSKRISGNSLGSGWGPRTRIWAMRWKRYYPGLDCLRPKLPLVFGNIKFYFSHNFLTKWRKMKIDLDYKFPNGVLYIPA